MLSLPALVAIGPCLMMAMAAVALAVVSLGLSRARHALFWSAGSAAGMLQWGAIVCQSAWPGYTEQLALCSQLLGTASALLLVEGFRLRRGTPHGRFVLVAVGACAALVLLATAGIPAWPVRAIIMPLFWIGLLLWAADMVVTPGARPSATETTVVAVLLGVAMVHCCGAALVIAGQLHLVSGRNAYAAVYLTAAQPASAAVALAALMLIAYDYAMELQRMLHTDPLTGVLNREGWLHAARLAFERSRSRPLAMAVADIDHFKQVNDRFGHAAGDAALADVARHLAQGLGRDGTVARIGGEEFALLFPGMSATEALARVERLRRKLHTAQIDSGPDLRVTASFGVTERVPGEGVDEVFARADAALYRSKGEGRDRATLASTGAGW